MLAERAMAAPEGMASRSTTEMLVLRAVLERPGITVTELTAKLAIAQSRISQVVAALETEGLIQRYTDATDRRRQRIKPTKRFAEDIRERMARNARDALGPVIDGLPEREVGTILDVLVRLHELLQRANGILPDEERGA